MVSIDNYTPPQAGLPPHCTPTSPFLYEISIYFGVCIPTPLGLVSILFGSLSILSWLFAQMPQIYKNFQLKSAAGLSSFFLIEWLMGDLTNLLGGIFTKQATWQIVLASYYTFVDVCLVFQFFWYTLVLPRYREGSIHSNGSDRGDDDASSDLINSLSPINSNFGDNDQELMKDGNEESTKSPHAHTRPVNTPRFSHINYEKEAANSASSLNPGQWVGSSWAGPSPRTVMYAATVSALMSQTAAAPVTSHDELSSLSTKTTLEIVGVFISWCSTLLYLGSRLPQLYKNWQRQSTAGLSPYLFMAAFSGNFFYSASMLTNPNAWHNFGPYGGHGWVDESGSRRVQWILNAAPFFLGAFCVLFMDGTMGVQFLMYGDQQEKVVKVRDRQGIGRWQRVNGWMRGWIPSIRKERVVDLAESQRLLSQSRELDRHGHHSQYGGI